MQAAKKLAIMGCATMALYLLTVSGAAERLGDLAAERLGDKRMKNVVVVRETPAPTAAPMPLRVMATEAPAHPAMVETESQILPEMAPMEQAEAAPEQETADSGEILETTIQGGLSVNNATAYWVDVTEILSAGPGLSLPQGEPQILIIHTHSSEAYTQAGLDRYEPSDTNRTENTEFNIVRIGDELTEIFQQAGLNVIHDRGIYDYPSYTGS